MANNFLAQLVGGTNLTFRSEDVGGVHFPYHILANSAGVEIALATSTLQTLANTKLDTLHTDLAAMALLVDGLEGFTDGLETAIASTNTKLDTLNARGVETTSTPAAVVLVAATAKDLLAANASRVRSTFYNPLSDTLYVRKATLAGSPATAAAGGYDFIVPARSLWVSDPKEWAGGFNGICALAGSVNVSETV